MPGVPQEVIDAAQYADRKWGVPASISIAQWALESGWGAHMPPQSNNPFGIKAREGQPSVTVRTREVFKGKEVFIMAPFRKFANLVEAFDEHGKLLATVKAYAKAREYVHNAEKYADALTGVYATDPKYGALLRQIMSGRNLYQYDVP